MNEPASWKPLPVSFGDQVRIRRTAETEAAEVADRSGVVYVITTVPVSGVSIIGKPEEDTAINVFFEESGRGVWLAPQLAEFVDHNPGTTITLSGVPKRWTRTATGEWVESSRSIPLTERISLFRRILRRLLGK